MTERNASDLLEYLRCKAECNFVSDLHSPANAAAIVAAINGEADGEFPLRAWQETIFYLTGEAPRLRSVLMAQEYLRIYLQDSPEAARHYIDGFLS